MAATFRSHFRHPPQPQDENSSQVARKQSSRIPTKSSSSSDYAENKQSKATQHVSKLAKRASKTIPPIPERTVDTRSKTVARTPVTAAYNLPVAASKRVASVPPPSPEIPHAEASGGSTSRYNNVLHPPPMMRTPSLVSASTASTYDSPRSNGLRRKPSTIEQYAASKRAETPVAENDNTTMHRKDDDFDEAFENTVLGISLPSTTYNGGGVVESTFIKNGLAQRTMSADQPATREITPPVPNYAQSATPSTRYTDSPFSRVPTPSSTSSYSPAVFATSKTTTPRLRQPSPTFSRPINTSRPVERTDTSRLGLPPVRESSTSSSNSTVKPPDTRSALPRTESIRKPASAPPTNKASETSRPASRGKLTKERPRQNSSSSTSRPPQVQIPPELAHLNVDQPPKLSLNKALPPIRPTREGTPNLTEMTHPSPVVQSDLPRLYTTYHKRTPSQETPPQASPGFKSRFGLSPKSTSKQTSPRIDSAVSPPPAARHFARDPTPDPAPVDRPRLTRKDSPAVGPSPSKSPRFGFFSRKPKTEEAKPAEKPKRKPSKGPAAGTGHEGYGRWGLRGRSGSVTSSAGQRSASTDSTASSQQKKVSTGRKSSVTSKDGSDLDEFLRERLTPVVLRGSGSTVCKDVSSSEAPVSTAESSNHSSLEGVPRPQLLPSAMDSLAGLSPLKQRPQTARNASDSSEDDVRSRYPTLAARRSLTRLSQGEANGFPKIPAPINTHISSKNSSMDSYDNDNSAWPQTDSSLPVNDAMNGKEGMWLRSPPVAESEPKPSRRWNFFQRAQASSPRNKGKEKAVVPHETPRTAIHHHMADSLDQVGLEEVERIMRETETSAEDSMSESNVRPKVVPYERRHKGLLPSPPKQGHLQASSAKGPTNAPQIRVRADSSESPELMRAQQTVAHHAPHVVEVQRSPVVPDREQNAASTFELQPQTSQSRDNVYTPEMVQSPFDTPDLENGSPQRPPRLSPIGRIPKVVSKRDQDRKLSENSFSRPFVRAQPKPTVKPPGSLYTQIRELASPIESGSQPVSSTSTTSNGAAGDQQGSTSTNPTTDSTNRTSMEFNPNSEFFVFPRKDSEISYSSSSGNNSVMAILAAQPPQQEDIWNEYNDLLDDVMPQRIPLSAASSNGAPFQYSTVLYDSPAMNGSQHWSQLSPLMEVPPSEQQSHAPSTILSVPQQIARFMHPSMSPLTTPQALSDVFNNYGNRSTSTLISQARASFQSQKYSGMPQPNRTSNGGTQRTSTQGPNRSSLPRSSRSSLPSARGSMGSSARHSRASGHSRSASLPEANARNSQSSLSSSVRFNRDTQLLDIAEVDGDEQAADSNLRFGALMTSKWLSFGRVLFSPAHNEMSLADDPRVLIIDGLGSDWSYYVALSYPAATVYDLGPAPVNGETLWPGVDQKAPSNHRHINHSSISAAFPFPKGFFTAVVFRFPVATTDQAYQACIFECKRVLRPGGHLEVAALDLDLMNMGNKGRKELRGLKTRMQQNDGNVSLRNLSDVLVRLIGRRGFEEIQRCIVGVPAAGRIPRSQDMSSINSDSSGKPIWQREDGYGQDFSFADLLQDARASQIEPGKGNDEGITKMVAKVGRWWYTTCYEKALLQTDNSIWNNPPLLRECERQGTSFRLLICYAQKPTQTRRRTVSV